MWVKLHYKTKDNELFGIKKQMTVKEAIALFNKKLKNDNNIKEVYLIYFDGWHWYRHKTLKGDNKK